MKSILLGIAGIVLLMWGITTSLSLDDWSQLAQIVTTFTVVIALGAYLHQKKKDRAVAVGEQVGFFRTVVISLEEQRIGELVSKDIQREEIVGIKDIEEFSFKWFLAWRLEETRKQFRVKKKLEDSLGYQHQQRAIEVLNALEEFCIKIEAHDIVVDKRLSALGSAFVEIVNLNAFYIPYMRKRYDNPKMYEAIARVYAKWYLTVKMRDPEEVKKELERELAEGEKVRTDSKTT